MWWGIGATAVYVVLSLILGDRLPFSRYEMYSGAALRTEGAVPVFLVDGQPAKVLEYDRFHDLDVGSINSNNWPCFVLREVHETHRWVHDNTAGTDTPKGAHTVAWGYALYSVDEAGVISHRQELLTKGTAWSRS